MTRRFTAKASRRAQQCFFAVVCLYAGWGFACLFGGTIIASSLASLIHLFR